MKITRKEVYIMSQNYTSEFKKKIVCLHEGKPLVKTGE
jgi:hypothetical protein